MKVTIRAGKEERSYHLVIPEYARLPPVTKGLRRVLKGSIGKRLPDETAEQYFLRVFIGKDLFARQYQISQEDGRVYARENTSSIPFVRRYTELEFRIENDSLVYQGYRDNVKTSGRIGIEVEGEGKPRKRHWTGLKSLGKWLGILYFAGVTGYTAADVALYGVSKKEQRVYQEVLEKTKLPVRTPEIIITRGQKSDSLIAPLFSADCDGQAAENNRIRINELTIEGFLAEPESGKERTLIKELLTIAYFNMNPRDREKIRKRTLPVAEKVLQERERCILHFQRKNKLEKELEEELKIPASLVSSHPDYLYHSPPQDIDKGLYSKIVAWHDSLEIMKKFGRNAFTPGGSEKELGIERLRAAEIYPEISAVILTSDKYVKTIPLTSDMFGIRVSPEILSSFNRTTLYELGGYSINARFTDKCWADFPEFWLMNFSFPVTRIKRFVRSRQLLAEERDEMRRLQELERKAKIEMLEEFNRKYAVPEN